MSELNEELLNDDVDDFPEIGEAEEDALLADDGDVLNLVPEEELGETSETDHKHASDSEEKRGSRQDKFATERQRITAPEPSIVETANKNRFDRQTNRGRGRGGRYQQQQGRYQTPFNHQVRQYNHGPLPGRNKTVLINPRFQGVVHVNNNARLAWDTQQQQFQPNPWAGGGPPANMGPPMQSMQQPPHQMQALQHGPPQMQYQPPMQFQGPPQMQSLQGPGHMQPMHQGPPMQNMGSAGQQMQFISPPQQPFMPQPLPPGVPQSPMQPPNLPTPSSYWDGQNQVTTVPQGPHQQMAPPYMQNNFESPQPVIINTSQPPPQMQTPNFQYNHQFNHNGPPMQQQQPFDQYPNFVQPNHNRQVFANNPNNLRSPPGNMGPPLGHMAPIKRNMFSPKRKIPHGTFAQNKKRFVHDRLGPVEQTQVKVKNVTIKMEDRPSVVKEVTVTNVTTVKLEDDEQTRDLRLKIEEQKRKREQVLQWKELRRLENLKQVPTQVTQQPNQQAIRRINQGQGRGRGGHHQHQNRMQHQHSGGSVRAPVLQPVKQIDEQRQFAGRGRNQKPNAQNGNKLIIMAPVTVPVVPVEDPEVQLDKKHLSTFLADRKVLVKDETLMSTRKVTIKNIASSTGDKKIFQFCKSIGEVQKLHRDKNDRHATITFKSVASAHAFFKKYQRHMLDLSMIEVSLTPESDGQE